MAVIEVFEREISIVEMLKRAGFADSNSEGRRLIEGRGAKLDGEIVSAANLVVRQDAVLSRGKNRFAKVVFMHS